jgi:hypothetical protein
MWVHTKEVSTRHGMQQQNSSQSRTPHSCETPRVDDPMLLSSSQRTCSHVVMQDIKPLLEARRAHTARSVHGHAEDKTLHLAKSASCRIVRARPKSDRTQTRTRRNEMTQTQAGNLARPWLYAIKHRPIPERDGDAELWVCSPHGGPTRCPPPC